MLTELNKYHINNLENLNVYTSVLSPIYVLNKVSLGFFHFKFLCHVRSTNSSHLPNFSHLRKEKFLSFV